MGIHLEKFWFFCSTGAWKSHKNQSSRDTATTIGMPEGAWHCPNIAPSHLSFWYFSHVLIHSLEKCWFFLLCQGFGPITCTMPAVSITKTDFLYCFQKGINYTLQGFLIDFMVLSCFPLYLHILVLAFWGFFIQLKVLLFDKLPSHRSFSLYSANITTSRQFKPCSHGRDFWDSPKKFHVNQNRICWLQTK